VFFVSFCDERLEGCVGVRAVVTEKDVHMPVKNIEKNDIIMHTVGYCLYFFLIDVSVAICLCCPNRKLLTADFLGTRGPRLLRMTDQIGRSEIYDRYISETNKEPKVNHTSEYSIVKEIEC
jgi:hypothetical protein